MVKTSNNNYIYITIPTKYECIYSNLLNMVSGLGLDTIKDCYNPCSNKGKLILECWDMFQAGIIAYDNNRENDADIIMIDIVNKLNLSCDTKCFSDKYIYYGQSDDIPTIDDIINGDKVIQSVDSFVAPYYKDISYIALPTGKGILSIENTTFRGDYLLNDSIDLYNNHKTIVINGELYLLYICELNYPLGSNIEVIMKDLNWFDKDIILYGNSVSKPTQFDIDSAGKFNPNAGNGLIFNSDNITHFIIVPHYRKVDYIRSINGTIDWLYNNKMNIDLYNKENITIDNQDYVMYWFESIEPINGDIKLKLI